MKATIYPTMWRPITIKGVPRDYGVFAIIASAVVFPLGILLASLFTKNGQLFGFVFAGLFFVSAWTLGYFLGRRDPEFLTVHLARVLKVGRTKGGEGGNEYSA